MKNSKFIFRMLFISLISLTSFIACCEPEQPVPLFPTAELTIVATEEGSATFEWWVGDFYSFTFVADNMNKRDDVPWDEWVVRLQIPVGASIEISSDDYTYVFIDLLPQLGGGDRYFDQYIKVEMPDRNINVQLIK
jgi:hypothetical protein